MKGHVTLEVQDLDIVVRVRGRAVEMWMAEGDGWQARPVPVGPAGLIAASAVRDITNAVSKTEAERVAAKG